jgi:hypothetical protein
MEFHPSQARRTKAARTGDLVLDKTFTVVPRGVALVIGCQTFPTWNSYPGLFASLVTGNPMIVKPHPGAVLPLAIALQAARQVLTGAGFDPHLVTLAAEDAGAGLAKALATQPGTKIIDYTGGIVFGRWLEDNARQAQVFTEVALDAGVALSENLTGGVYVNQSARSSASTAPGRSRGQRQLHRPGLRGEPLPRGAEPAVGRPDGGGRAALREPAG